MIYKLKEDKDHNEHYMFIEICGNLVRYFNGEITTRWEPILFDDYDPTDLTYKEAKLIAKL